MGSFINKALSSTGITINDDRGNPINLPINQITPTGIYRTYVNSNNPGNNVMVNLDSDTDSNPPLGFTPPEFFYVQGNKLVSTITGFSVETGLMPSIASLVNNTGVGKIARTQLNYTPANASPLPTPDGKVVQHGNNTGQDIYNTSTVATSTAGNKYPSTGHGFTNPFDYITDTTSNNTTPGLTGIPTQFGSNPSNIVPNWNNQNASYNSGIDFEVSQSIYSRFNNEKQYNWVHNLDYSLGDGTGQVRSGTIDQSTIANSSSSANPLKNIYLGSFIQTSDDNEDPTMYGYDIIINYNSSPLFNGAIIDFIDQFGGTNGDQEIESRRTIWTSFCNQFFKYFGIDQPSMVPFDSTNYSSSTASTTSTIPVISTLSGSSIPQKAYYLKKISGLEKLVEGDIMNASESVKTMVDYGKDLINLTLYEDVSVNTGYLAMLYKTLAWSRYNGKQIIPENLLRFDAQITITEIRDYNRVIKDANAGSSLTVYADFLSRYTYDVFDCQFKFEKLPHGTEIDMWSSSFTPADNYDIAFNYKYSTLRFDKFSFSGTQSQQYSIFNGQSDVVSVTSKNSNSVNTSNNTLDTSIGLMDLEAYDYWPKNTSNNNFSGSSSTQSSVIDNLAQSSLNSSIDLYGQSWQTYLQGLSNGSTLDNANSANSISSMLSTLGKKLTNAVVNDVNRQITTQARLLNNTLDNIRNSIGLGRMSDPTNVYNGSSLLANDVSNALRDFVGQSVKGFFTM